MVWSPKNPPVPAMMNVMLWGISNDMPTIANIHPLNPDINMEASNILKSNGESPFVKELRYLAIPPKMATIP